MHSTSVRIDSDTHDELKRLSQTLGLTVGQTVSVAVRTLRQERAGRQLAAPSTNEERAWLDSDLG